MHLLFFLKKKRVYFGFFEPYVLRKLDCLFVGVAYQGLDIWFRFIIECSSSLRDFHP
jgi:hypothetical protein